MGVISQITSAAIFFFLSTFVRNTNTREFVSIYRLQFTFLKLEFFLREKNLTNDHQNTTQKSIKILITSVKKKKKKDNSQPVNLEGKYSINFLQHFYKCTELQSCTIQSICTYNQLIILHVSFFSSKQMTKAKTNQCPAKFK